MIKVRIDEWVEKVEFSDEGMFIYLDESLREDVLDYLEKELGEADG